MKKAGIKLQVMILGILPMLIVTLILTIISISHSISILEDALYNRGTVIATQLAPASEYGVVSGNLSFLQPLIQQAMQNEGDIVNIIVTDHLGHILAQSGREVMHPPQNSARKTSPDIVREKHYIMFTAPVFRNTVEVNDFFEANPEHVDSSVSPDVIGQIYVTMDTTNAENRKNADIHRNMAIAVISMLLTAFFAWRLGRKISKPIESLAGAVNTVSKGHFDLRVAENAMAELLTLQQGFNHMADRLSESHAHLQDRIEDATIQLSYQAQHDVLTGLVNRREFERRLESALLDAREKNYSHVFCYMDLDQFKIVNDTCGHQAGDELLRQISLVLSNRVRDTDTLARLGGDEFGLLLRNCIIDVAMTIVEELRATVEEFRFVHGDKIFKIGVSIGMVPISKQSQSISTIMASADTACYTAKETGRNRIHVYEPMDDDLHRRQGEMEWVGRINKAIEDDRFCLFAQPIVPLKNTPALPPIYEILLRKIDSDGSLIPPMAFIPAAERYHLMPLIDRWVISHSFAWYRSQMNHHTPIGDCLFSINLSGVSLSDKYLLEFIKLQFEEYQIPPTRICFEITETSAIVNLANTMHLMSALKRFGCKFLLDDFGSGMSSFTYLKNLPVDLLKMDGSFVQDIANNEIDLAMVKSIHSIAETMQIKTIAEFVESDATKKLLIDIGVDYAQGFLLGKPVPLAELKTTTTAN